METRDSSKHRHQGNVLHSLQRHSPLQGCTFPILVVLKEKERKTLEAESLLSLLAERGCRNCWIHTKQSFHHIQDNREFCS